jgi:hypothetical protein
MLMLQTRETVKACRKCGIRHIRITAGFCEDCKPRFRGKFCFKHVFSILNMDENRIIKCNTENCNETRKG